MLLLAVLCLPLTAGSATGSVTGPGTGSDSSQKPHIIIAGTNTRMDATISTAAVIAGTVDDVAGKSAAVNTAKISRIVGIL